MKAARVKDARDILKEHGCQYARNCGRHEIWSKVGGQTFALPTTHNEVSPGVLRKLIKFATGRN